MSEAIRPGQRLLPVLAMRGIVMFEGSLAHFDVGREKSLKALDYAMQHGRRILLVTQRDIMTENPTTDNLYQYGVLAEIKQMFKTQDGISRVLVDCIQRIKLGKIREDEPFLQSNYRSAPLHPSEVEEDRMEAAIRLVKSLFEDYSQNVPKMNEDVLIRVMEEQEPHQLFCLIGQNTMLSYEQKQELLEQNTDYLRLQRLAAILDHETNVMVIEQDLFDTVRENLDRNQREYVLREQMKAIQQQLGEDGYGSDQEELEELQQQIKAIQNISDQSREKLLKEWGKLSKMPAMSQEAGVIRGYLETVLELPWDASTEDNVDLKQARKILNEDHYGLEKVKDRILESLAVRQLKPQAQGQILCLVGPPGVGKTSIGKSIARAMGRTYVRLSLGGVKDESDIRGHRKTYVGAMPGRIINALTQAKVNNPLILLDEIDKMANDFRGDPASAMLEVLDGEQNNTFRDHYIELPFDLSKVLFITTANDLSTVSPPLLDRMDVIELSSYTREEKFHIAKEYLVKKQMEKHGLTGKDAAFSNPGLYTLIDRYTREAGVRTLERRIGDICRKIALEKVTEGEEFTKKTVNGKLIEKYLGPKKFRVSSIPKTDPIGLVTGLAWTSVGGETLEIEVSCVEGTGKVEITGNLGSIMTESAKLAVTYVRSIADRYHIPKDFYKTKDIHIHAPEGAVPKDGPSAGVTMTTALVSALAKIPVRRTVAMTGEISLRGRVLPIGGLKEKSIAAYRAGVKTVLIPAENLPDLEEIDPSVRKGMEFLPMETIDQVLEHALVLPEKSDAHRSMDPPVVLVKNPAPGENATIQQ